VEAVLLDTDVFSYLLKGDSRAEFYRKHIQGKTVALTFVTVGELYHWAEKRKWGAKKIANLEQRFRATVIVPYDLEICRIYGGLRSRLKTSQGSQRNLGANDLWIAACAIRHSLTLLTNNQKDFEGIPELKLIYAPTQAKASAAAPNLFSSNDES
jgi:tRNA(fMet)-specific endonuclease VapC